MAVIIRSVYENCEYQGLPGCIRLSNGTISLIVSTGFGPRILSYGFDGGENVFGWHGEAAVSSELGTWKPYGGHRLWLAPENMPRSYAPDNHAVEVRVTDDLSVELELTNDAAAIGKKISVSLAAQGSAVTVEHTLTNNSDKDIEMAVWALSIMRPGGTAIVPNEPFVPYGPATLLPVRTFAVWPYTHLADPRWAFSNDEIRLRVDGSQSTPQKFGVLNKQGWAAYEWERLRFVKRFDFVAGAAYPDMNSNTEIYTAGDFVEVETLSPLKQTAPGESIFHQERWELERLDG